jgi:hypothetical protein
MADWKQITARIRRARSGKDPAGQLTNLFSKTRDAMVAFELARYFESKGNNDDAGRWYLTAAERFRRADWKTKAQECAARLGATEAAEVPVLAPRDTEGSQASSEAAPDESAQQDSQDKDLVTVAADSESEEVKESAAPVSSTSSDSSRQRRGRRGGRDQRHGRRSGGSPTTTHRERSSEPSPSRRSREDSPEPAPAPSRREIAAESALPSSGRSRFGDPGLSSRLSQLEMNFRRLLACPPCSLGDAEKAPAGPGVWVLTDSDMSTYYYVEPCQTLRVAIPHLLRGGSGGANARRGESLKPRLADHLGIPETRVAKYLSDHCVVRWLQMDEDASHFAHFLIAVLHPALNE